MKNIISFSLWGDNDKYLTGAIENIKLQNKFFPDWICRFYVHDSVPRMFVSHLKDLAEVIEKEGDLGGNMDRPGMFWRFEVLKDPEIERCIVRDADSRLGQRDKNCVQDWFYSKKEFHIIRDNAMHNTKIMGGMWGATKEFITRINYDDLVNQFNKMTYNNLYATDQEFLARMIYPLIKDSVCIHDNWDRYKENARTIPHIRVNNEYIGQPIEI